MSRYIIEIEEKPLCVFDKDTQTFFPRLWRVKGFNSLVFDEEGLSRLDELNSDYINEHFSKLLQDAHDTGYKEGYAKKVEVMFDGEYQRGLEDGKAVNDKGCEGCKYQANRELTCPCSECANNFRNQWTAKDDKIEVGDTVNAKDCETNDGIVTKIWNDNYYVLWSDGSGGMWNKENIVKTGRHFDIASILEAMKHD